MTFRHIFHLGCVLVLLFLNNSILRAAEDSLLMAGPGYYTFLPNKVLLTCKLDPTLSNAGIPIKWTKFSGPGTAVIERPDSTTTWATVSAPGTYLFKVKTTNNLHYKTVRVNVFPESQRMGNPILPGMFPDPHIMYDGGKFYIYATSMENDLGSYGRASVWMSDDFVNWEMKLTNWPAYGTFGGDIWAPDIIRKDNKYYQFITRSGSYDTWIGIADQPIGPWKNARTDNTPIVSGGGNAGRIVAAYNMDSQPFIDDDGQAYMYWGWAESMAAKLTSNLTNIDGAVHFLKGTKWVANGGTLPQWLMVDLGSSMPITKIMTHPEFKDIAYGYTIESSENKVDWTLLADRRTNTTVAGDGYIDNVQGTGRYVRINLTNCQGNWASLYDFSVYSGENKVSLNKLTTASSLRGTGSEALNATDISNGPYLEDYVEGSYMIKHNGTYYLMYSTGALHDGSYSVHYAMGDNPFGPFVRPNPNIVIRMNANQTTKGPGHNSVLKFGGNYYIVYHQHNQPHEDGALVFRQTCADKLEFNPDGTIKEVTPTQSGIEPLQPLVSQGRNVALGCYAKASSVKTESYAPEYAFDQNNASKWRAAKNTYPQTITVDLNGIQNISRMETSFEYPTLSYKYKIETSEDGKTWFTYVDKSSAFPVAVSPQKDIKQAKAAFVRMTIYGCQRSENGAGIYELKVMDDPFKTTNMGSSVLVSGTIPINTTYSIWNEAGIEVQKGNILKAGNISLPETALPGNYQVHITANGSKQCEQLSK